MIDNDTTKPIARDLEQRNLLCHDEICRTKERRRRCFPSGVTRSRLATRRRHFSTSVGLRRAAPPVGHIYGAKVKSQAILRALSPELMLNPQTLAVDVRKDLLDAEKAS